MLSPELSLHPFLKTDQVATVMFWTQIWTEMNWKLDKMEGADDVAKLFRLPKGVCILLKRHTDVVGCAGILPLESGVGLLKRFYLAPSLRGKGLAAPLLSEMITQAKEKKMHTLVLDVSNENKRAQQFYLKMGFQPFDPAGHGYEFSWSESTKPDKYHYLQMKIST